MKRSLGILIVAAVVSTVAVSCARKAKVIPVRKMEKIYREMFLADHSPRKCSKRLKAMPR